MIYLFKLCDVVELFQDGRDMYFDRVNLQRVLLTHEMVSKRAALSFFYHGHHFESKCAINVISRIFKFNKFFVLVTLSIHSFIM